MYPSCYTYRVLVNAQYQAVFIEGGYSIIKFILTMLLVGAFCSTQCMSNFCDPTHYMSEDFKPDPTIFDPIRCEFKIQDNLQEYLSLLHEAKTKPTKVLLIKAIEYNAHGSASIIEVLLQAGVQPDEKDLDLAKKLTNKEAITLLEKHLELVVQK